MQLCRAAGGARQPCLVDWVDCSAQPTNQPDQSPKWEAHTLSPLASRPVALGGAASFRPRDHARHWRTILYALIYMSETEYY